MPQNNPCSATPGSPSSVRARAAGSSMRPNAQSRMRKPLSVRYGSPAFMRSVGLPPRRSRSRATTGSANGATSTGTGNAPSFGTSFFESTTTMKRRAREATIFSRRCAPPPPLMSSNAGSTSSAPSIATSKDSTSASGTSGMPAARAQPRVVSDVGTPRILSPARTRTPKASTAYLDVDPLPRPTSMPSSTKSAARYPARRFSASTSDRTGSFTRTPVCSV